MKGKKMAGPMKDKEHMMPGMPPKGMGPKDMEKDEKKHKGAMVIMMGVPAAPRASRAPARPSRPAKTRR